MIVDQADAFPLLSTDQYIHFTELNTVRWRCQDIKYIQAQPHSLTFFIFFVLKEKLLFLNRISPKICLSGFNWEDNQHWLRLWLSISGNKPLTEPILTQFLNIGLNALNSINAGQMYAILETRFWLAFMVKSFTCSCQFHSYFPGVSSSIN